MSILWRARRVAGVLAEDGENPTGQTKTRRSAASYDRALTRFLPELSSQPVIAKGHRTSAGKQRDCFSCEGERQLAEGSRDVRDP